MGFIIGRIESVMDRYTYAAKTGTPPSDDVPRAEVPVAARLCVPRGPPAA